MICLSGHIRTNPAIRKRMKDSCEPFHNNPDRKVLRFLSERLSHPLCQGSGHNPDIGLATHSSCRSTGLASAQRPGIGGLSYVLLMCNSAATWRSESVVKAKLNRRRMSLARGLLAWVKGCCSIHIRLCSWVLPNLSKFVDSGVLVWKSRYGSRILMCCLCAVPVCPCRFADAIRTNPAIRRRHGSNRGILPKSIVFSSLRIFLVYGADLCRRESGHNPDIFREMTV